MLAMTPHPLGEDVVQSLPPAFRLIHRIRSWSSAAAIPKTTRRPTNAARTMISKGTLHPSIPAAPLSIKSFPLQLHHRTLRWKTDHHLSARHRQCPPDQTQREPFQRQLPRTQRAGVRQPRGIGGGPSFIGGGIGGRGCAKAVRNGSTKVARHATNTALRSRIVPAPSAL